MYEYFLKNQRIQVVSHLFYHLFQTLQEVLAKVGWSGAVIARNSELQELRGVDKYGIDCNQNFEMILSF